MFLDLNLNLHLELASRILPKPNRVTESRKKKWFIMSVFFVVLITNDNRCWTIFKTHTILTGNKPSLEEAWQPLWIGFGGLQHAERA